MCQTKLSLKKGGLYFRGASVKCSKHRVLRHLIERHLIERHLIERHLIKMTVDKKKDLLLCVSAIKQSICYYFKSYCFNLFVTVYCFNNLFKDHYVFGTKN